jgi:hypothetical protein
LALLGLATPASATPREKIYNPEWWGVLGAVLVQQGRVQRRDTRSYTRPSLVAFVVIKTGRSYYVSDLGESNEGDSTYYFDKDISFVITCLFV